VETEEKSVCVITPVFKTLRCPEVPYNSAKPAGTPLVIYVPKPYASQNVVPYNYGPAIPENSKEIPLPPPASVDNIAESNKILRSGRVPPTVVQEKTSEPILEPTQVQGPDKGKRASQPNEIVYEDSDEIYKLIKRSEYKIVDQLLQTPSKISIM